MLAAFFSPTGTTRKIVMDLSTHLKEALDTEEMNDKNAVVLKTVDFTPLSERTSNEEIRICRDELFILGIPVYAGRVPNVLLPYLNRFRGDKTKAVIVAVYGNRHYDDALMELSQLLVSNGFEVIAGCAFIGEHAFSNVLAAGRPDTDDLLASKRFAYEIANKLTHIGSQRVDNLIMPGQWPLRPYYRPVDDDGFAFDFKRIVPITMTSCVECGLCAKLCPVQSISYVDNRTITRICIKCCSCVKHCPVEAKQFDNPNFLKHKKELEADFFSRRSPECFL